MTISAARGPVILTLFVVFLVVGGCAAPKPVPPGNGEGKETPQLLPNRIARGIESYVAGR